MDGPNPYANPYANLSTTAPLVLFGQLVNNVNDWYIAREFARIISLPDGAFNPANRFPLPIHAPPGNPPYQSRGPAIISSACVVIFLVLLIAGTRLSLRYFRKDLKIGYDDYVIISAALGVVS